MDIRYFRPGFGFALAHLVEECGETLAAAGKTPRAAFDFYPTPADVTAALLAADGHLLRGYCEPTPGGPLVWEPCAGDFSPSLTFYRALCDRAKFNFGEKQ